MPRGSDYTEALADRICDELMGGKSLVKICEAPDMPDRVTVIRWQARYPEFATRCAHARETQAELMDDKISDIADGTVGGMIDPHAAKVAISAYQWRASKLKPKIYGDKQTIDMNATVSVKDVPEDELDARISRHLAGATEAGIVGSAGGTGVPAVAKRLRS